uniref:Uncharacterized protein n=1 Tax=Arundo donax TaxID=35708 RepID=A0A0A9BF91_ARUDO
MFLVVGFLALALGIVGEREEGKKILQRYMLVLLNCMLLSSHS